MPETNGYPHAAELLESTEWLAEHLDDEGVVVLDGRRPEEYGEGHIPGAILVPSPAFKAQGSLETCSADEFASFVGALGVRSSDTVICYDASGPVAARLWWAFARFGHPEVRYLHGGWRKWAAEDRPVEQEAASRAPVVYELGSAAEELACTLPQAIERLSADDVLFWDTRSLEEFTGERGMNNPPERVGHIPRAVHLEWNELTEPEWGMFRPAEEMREVLASKGITPESEVVTY